MIEKTSRNEEIVEMVRAGRTYSEVARTYNISTQRVQQLCRFAGVKSSFRPSEQIKRQAIEMLNANIKVSHIAEKLNVNELYVYRLRDRYFK